MRAFACVLAISLLCLGGPVAAQAPRQVASLKLCTDELLMLLAPPERIASITFLSQQPLETPLWRIARRHHANDGSLLSVAGLRPNLVVDMGGGGRDTARIARRLGIRLLMLPYPQSLADVERSIAVLAIALGRKREGERLLARIQALRQSAPAGWVDTIWLGGGGRSLAPTSLGAEWMALAGFRQRALPGNRLTLEQMLARPPALLLRSDYRAGQYSSEQRWLSHPLLKRRGRTRTLATDGRRWTCYGPLMIDEVLRLRKHARP